MLTPHWQLETPLDAIIFDCDSTLCQIEGIDELACINGVANAVKQLTEAAMGKMGINPSLYVKRLLLTRPRAEQMMLIGEKYIQNLSPDAVAAIQFYQRIHKSIYIVSAGMLPALLIVGRYLKIPDSHVFGVDIHFSPEGQLKDFDRNSVLIENTGKYNIVKSLLQRHPRIAYVGDGLNDIPTQSLVTRFIGYGGARFRENIADICEYYITESSFASLLPLTLTSTERKNLKPTEQKLFAKGIHAIDSGAIQIKEKKP